MKPTLGDWLRMLGLAIGIALVASLATLVVLSPFLFLVLALGN